jgi:hypothetical protein
MNPHKVLLLTVLGLGAAALAYNAYSILRGETGLTGLSLHRSPTGGSVVPVMAPNGSGSSVSSRARATESRARAETPCPSSC